MKLSKKVALPLLILFSIAVSLSWYYGVTMIFSTIVDEFVSLARVLPYFLFSIVLILSFLILFFQFFIKPVKRIRGLIYTSLLTAVTLLSFVLSFLHLSFYFVSSDFYSKALILILNMIGSLAFLVLLFLLYLPKERKEIELPKLTLSLYKKILLPIVFLFVSYYLADGIRAFIRFSEYTVEPVAYPFFVFILFYLAYAFVLTLIKKKTKAYFYLSSVSAFVSLASLGALIGLTYTQAYVHVSQNIFYIDFAASKPIGPLSWMVLLLLSFLDLFFFALRYPRENKKEA